MEILLLLCGYAPHIFTGTAIALVLWQFRGRYV
jgi:hypothetical protein